MIDKNKPISSYAELSESDFQEGEYIGMFGKLHIHIRNAHLLRDAQETAAQQESEGVAE